jgi:hypothetical protein
MGMTRISLAGRKPPTYGKVAGGDDRRFYVLAKRWARRHQRSGSSRKRVVENDAVYSPLLRYKWMAAERSKRIAVAWKGWPRR